MQHQKFGFGAPVRRKEDPALLLGKGQYMADIAKEGMAYAAFIRSPIAHATFTIENTADVQAMPGVVAVVTAKDVAHLGTLPCIGNMPNADGTMPVVPEHRLLPLDTVRYVGEPIALVIAQSEKEARDAIEAFDISFDDLPHCVDPKRSLDGDAPEIWPDIGSNLAFNCHVGSKEDEVDEAFRSATTTVRLELVNNRVITNYIEPRGAIAEYDSETKRRTLTVSSQGVHSIQRIMAKNIFNADPETIRVITPDVGGGFGTKIFAYREYGSLLYGAEVCGRPVRWISDRSEHFLGDYQGRDHVTVAELALDADNHFLAMRVDILANMGAYLSQYGPYIPVGGAAMAPGTYKTPLVSTRIRGVYTNTVPVDAYRGAGRPEATYVVERLVDKAALELGIAPSELRRKNFVQPEMMPFTTPTERTYDSGDFAAHMDAAMEIAKITEFPERLKASNDDGRLRGWGLATYIEACGGGGSEFAEVRLGQDGTATIFVGTQSNGQGHHTAYSQLAHEKLGLPMDAITVVQGDTDLIPRGSGTGGSRSIPVGGTSVLNASAELAERLKQKASDKLEAAPGDMELSAGLVRIAGTDRAVPVADLATEMSEDERSAINDWKPPAPTYPNGTHLIELEIDPDTGVIALQNYVVVDDFGVTLNPILLEGQIHGGIAQGVGQAMTERTVYDTDSGQLLTATFMDYGMPRADDLPMITFETRNVPSVTNAMGLKGAGEAGAIGACPALVNAAIDALYRAFGVTEMDMPMTPESVWEAIQQARKSQAA